MEEVNYKNIALYLFYLLDDIDTASDIAKGNEKMYRELVEAHHRRRFDVATTDGYSVTFKNMEKN